METKETGACVYIEAAFEILGRKWNGRITHYMGQRDGQEARFSEIQRDLGDISPRALSLKLTELVEYGILIKCETESGASCYRLTEEGSQLASAMTPLGEWARRHAGQPAAAPVCDIETGICQVPGQISQPSQPGFTLKQFG